MSEKNYFLEWQSKAKSEIPENLFPHKVESWALERQAKFANLLIWRILFPEVPSSSFISFTKSQFMINRRIHITKGILKSENVHLAWEMWVLNSFYFLDVKYRLQANNWQIKKSDFLGQESSKWLPFNVLISISMVFTSLKTLQNAPIQKLFLRVLTPPIELANNLAVCSSL